MMHHVRRWMRDERGTTFEGIALSVSIMAVGFVASADILNYISKKHGAEISTAVQNFAGTTSHATPGIDYTPTASIAGLRSGRVTLDPCTGQQK